MNHPTSKLKQFFPLWVGVFAFLWYLPGIARDPMPGDSSIYLTRAWNLSLNSYAQTHPLYLLCSHIALKLCPFASPPVVMGTLSAIFAAGTVALIYVAVKRLTGCHTPAIFSATCLTVAHTMWYHAVFAEVYSMNTFFTAAMLLSAITWAHYVSQHPESTGSKYLFLLGLSGGLGICNHLLAAISLAVCIIWVFFSRRDGHSFPARLVWISCGTLTGSAFILALLLHDMANLGVFEAIKMFFFGGMGVRGVHPVFYSSDMMQFFTKAGARQIILSILALIYNFPGIILCLFFAKIRQWHTNKQQERRSQSSHRMTDGWKNGWLDACDKHKMHGIFREDRFSCQKAVQVFEMANLRHKYFSSNHPGIHLSNLPWDPCEKRFSSSPPDKTCALLPNKFFWLLAALFAAHFFYGCTYTIHEGWAFLLPAWLPLACLLGISLAKTFCSTPFQSIPAKKRHMVVAVSVFLLVFTALIYRMASPAALFIVGNRLEKKLADRIMPSPREYAQFYLWPPKSGRSEQALIIKSALETVPDDAHVLLSPANHAMAYYYQNVEGLKPELFVRGTSLSRLTQGLASGQPVFIDRIRETKRLTPTPNINKKDPRKLWAIPPTP